MGEIQFRSKIDDCIPTFGIFVKIPDIGIIELLAESQMDFVVLDQEHAPFDRRTLDTLLFAARALGLPALVRVPNTEASTILAALDGGAAGILLPHIGNADIARQAAAACRYASGRGYSGAVRSMRHRGNVADAIEAADRDIVVVAQVEDASAVGLSADIAACGGIDALFIGRGDLAVSMRAASSDAPEVWAAAQTIARSAAAHDKPSWAFAAGWAEADRLLALGVRSIVLGSDQSHLKAGASALVADARQRARRKTSTEKAGI